MLIDFRLLELAYKEKGRRFDMIIWRIVNIICPNTVKVKIDQRFKLKNKTIQLLTENVGEFL